MQISAGSGADSVVADRLRQLQRCLGGEWPDFGPLCERVERTEQLAGFRRQYVTYQLQPTERAGAWLLIPDGVTAASPAAGICVWHQHAGQYDVGKDEPAGVRSPNFGAMHMTGVSLVREGYVVLCPDAAGFGERNGLQQPGGGQLRGRDLEHYLFAMQVVAGRSLAWQNISDMRRAVSLLAGFEFVQSERLGCYGHSMGSTHTWLVGPFEPRLRALAGNCCLPTYEAMERTGLMHCFPNYIPGWRQYGDLPDIASLIAPRALHLNFGELDSGSPIAEVRAALPALQQAWTKAGVPENFSWFIESNTDHILSPEMWRRVRDHFRRHLG